MSFFRNHVGLEEGALAKSCSLHEGCLRLMTDTGMQLALASIWDNPEGPSQHFGCFWVGLKPQLSQSLSFISVSF